MRLEVGDDAFESFSSVFSGSNMLSLDVLARSFSRIRISLLFPKKVRLRIDGDSIFIDRVEVFGNLMPDILFVSRLKLVGNRGSEDIRGIARAKAMAT
jgi:hypothetical protein